MASATRDGIERPASCMQVASAELEARESSGAAEGESSRTSVHPTSSGVRETEIPGLGTTPAKLKSARAAAEQAELESDEKKIQF